VGDPSPFCQGSNTQSSPVAGGIRKRVPTAAQAGAIIIDGGGAGRILPLFFPKPAHLACAGCIQARRGEWSPAPCKARRERRGSNIARGCHAEEERNRRRFWRPARRRGR